MMILMMNLHLMMMTMNLFKHVQVDKLIKLSRDISKHTCDLKRDLIFFPVYQILRLLCVLSTSVIM